MRRVRWIALLILLASGVAAFTLGGRGASPTVELPAADAALGEPRGIAGWSTSLLDGFLRASAGLSLHSGYVALFARDGHLLHATTTGWADIEAERPMRLDTRFRMASMTKPVTAAALMSLVEEGRLSLDDPVARWLPAAGALRVAVSTEGGADGSIETVPLERPLTVRDLATFRAGMGGEPDDSDLGRLWAERDVYRGEGSLADRVDRILTAPLYEQPGRVWRYGWAAEVLARVTEVAAGEPLDRLLEERIFAPLGMTSTSYLPAEDRRDRLATMYTHDTDRNLVRVSRLRSDAPDWTPGGSGLVSTAGDWMRFALMLWNEGRYDGVQVLAPETVKQMTTAHITEGVLRERGIDGVGWGLGLAVVFDSAATPMIDRDGDFWWSGLYGTTFFVSPETGLAGVVMTQNDPSPHSPLPYPVYLAQTFPFFGL